MISGKPETRTFLGRTKPDSNNSIRSLQLPTFSTNRGVRFSFKDNSNGLKTLDSCTVCLTLGVHSTISEETCKVPTRLLGLHNGCVSLF
jgi:hypothetical protein